MTTEDRDGGMVSRTGGAADELPAAHTARLFCKAEGCSYEDYAKSANPRRADNEALDLALEHARSETHEVEIDRAATLRNVTVFGVPR